MLGGSASLQRSQVPTCPEHSASSDARNTSHQQKDDHMKRQVFTQFAVIGSAMFTGVMLTIGLSLGRYWWSLEADEFAIWFKDNFILLLPSVVVTLLPAFIGVGWLLKQDWNTRRRRGWLAALSGIGGASLITLIYHLPANLRLWGLDQTPTEITTELRLWMILHAVRVIAGLFGAVAALRTAIDVSPKSDWSD